MQVILTTATENNAAILRDVARAKIGKRRKKLPAAPRMLYPDSIDRRYRKLLRVYVARMRTLVNSILMPEVRKILTAAEIARPTVDSANLDEYDYVTELDKLMQLITLQFAGEYTDEVLKSLVLSIAEAVAAQNGKELGKILSSVLGVDVFAAEPWLAIEIRAFVTSNVALIKTIPSQYFPAIEQKVFDAARKGISYKVLQKDIQTTYGKSRARAELIARDQIGKFNGQLSLIRQTQAGITRYQWLTMRDARVRDEHRRQDLKIYSWDAPPSSGHPGEDYQCRCQATPYLDDLWKLPGEDLSEVPADLMGQV